MTSLAEFPGVQTAFSLKGLSTFGVGGPADFFYAAKTLEDLPSLLKTARAENVRVFVVGGGSNVLFSDEGFRGMVVHVTAARIQKEGDFLVVEAGAKWPAILAAAQEAGLTGFEPMSGLPGTIGGAVVGNAGCFGRETAELVKAVTLYDPETGEIRTVGPDALQFRYRWSRLKETHEVVLRVTLHSLPASSTAQAIQTLRVSKQPPGKTSGSFFKNPSPDQPAGWLIDQCGLKGLQIGGAQISPKHANFFMNTGGATAADLLTLRDRAKKAVQEKFGIELHEEVILVNP